MAHPLNHAGPWVLVVDDDKGFSLTVRCFLAKLGIPALAADSPSAAARALRGGPPAVCLVDLHLENRISGFIVLRALRRKFGDALPLLVVSGSSAPDVVAEALACGADGFLTKPLNLQALKSALNPYLMLDGTAEAQESSAPSPAGGIAAALAFPAEASLACEEGLKVISPHYVLRGAPVILSGSFLAGILGVSRCMASVHRCETASGGRFLLTLEFEEISVLARASLRKYLAGLDRKG